MVWPQLFVAVAVVVAGLAIGSVTPSPGGVVDVHVTQEATWHPLRGEWRLQDAQVRTERSTIISWTAIGRNAFTFGFSSPREVEYRLETLDGDVLQVQGESTGFGIPLVATTETLTVTFRELGAGSYLVRTILYDDSGHSVSEGTFPLTILEAPS